MEGFEKAIRNPESCVILDARSPSEFLEDHVPGALNIPVLDDAQRIEVGREYVQGSRHKARLIGASMVSANIAHQLATHEIFTKSGSEFLVMCFRGGLRSEALFLVLKETGFHVGKLEGGYKAYRTTLRERLATAPLLQATVVMGPTGSGKTKILRNLTSIERRFIDLEAHAGHRGSRFGPIGLIPRRQKAFESQLWADLVRCERIESRVLLEGESMRIGNCYLPRPFWEWMGLQPQIWVDLPRQERSRFLVEDYLGKPPDEARILSFIGILRTLRMELGGQRVDDVESKVLSGKYFEAADILLEHFFDPHYKKHLNATRNDVRRISASSMEELELALRDSLSSMGG